MSERRFAIRRVVEKVKREVSFSIMEFNHSHELWDDIATVDSFSTAQDLCSRLNSVGALAGEVTQLRLGTQEVSNPVSVSSAGRESRDALFFVEYFSVRLFRQWA